MNTAVLALLGYITAAQAVEQINQDWPNNELTCEFGVERLNHGENADFANHQKGTLFNDKEFPAARSSLYWSDYNSSSIRSKYSAITSW